MSTLHIQQEQVEATRAAVSAYTGKVYLYGRGAIASAICHALESALGRAHVARGLPETATTAQDIVIAATDNCLFADLLPFVQDHPGPVFFVHVHDGEAVIGPEVIRGRSGCIYCWRSRYYAGRNQAHRWADGAVRKASTNPDPQLTPLSIALIASITALRVANILERSTAQDASLWQAYYLDLHTLTGNTRTLLPDPLCIHCSQRPVDAPESAYLTLISRPKSHAEEDRLRDVHNLSGVLFQAYVAPRAGIVSDVQHLQRITNAAVATTYIPLTDYTKTSHREPCSGFCDRYSIARSVAVLEALERYAGTRPRGRAFAVHDCLASLGDTAEDPRIFGWYGEQEYQANAAWLTRFDKDLKIDFTWVYSLKKQRPVLLPAQLVYYLEPSGSDPTYVIDSSVGCAIGNSPEEAMLHGLLEVIERDSFLLHWYASHSLAAFDVMDTHDIEVRAHYRRLRSEGYELTALDATTDFGVPAIILLAHHRDYGIPYASCIGAAHHHPDKALRKAFRELIGGLRRYGNEVKDGKLNYARALVENTSRVRTMPDHALLYCMPQSAEMLSFLTETRRRTTLQNLRDAGREFCSADLTEELQRLLQRVLVSAHDVFIVNQTAPELAKAGLYCYRVMVPGSIPMTWGQHMRRLKGIPRLDRALASLSGDKINMAKHPPNSAPHAFP